LELLYSLLLIAACVVFFGWVRRKSKSGKSGFSITPFLVGGLIVLVFIVLFFVLTRFGMDHLK
jgi:hypothetical protein